MTQKSHKTMTFGKVLLLIFVPSSPVHAKAMHQVEETLSRHPVPGMIVSLLSGFIAKLKMLEVPVPQPDLRRMIVDWSSDIGIVVGLLIGCLTLAIQLRKFYKDVIVDGKKRKRTSKSKVKRDSESLVQSDPQQSFGEREK